MAGKILTLALLFALAACGLPDNVIVLVPDEGGAVGKLVVSEDGRQRELAASFAAVGTGQAQPQSAVFIADESLVKRTFAGALGATPRTPQVFVIYFIIGQAEIDPRSTTTLADAVKAARETPDNDLSVVGHSDAIGDDNENLALSLRRAQAIRAVLLEGGVPATTIEINYHGSNNPRIPAPRGVPEPENRRVEVTVR